MVERFYHFLLVHHLRHIAGGQDNVVACAAGLQLGVHKFVRVEYVYHNLAVVSSLKLLDKFEVYVVGPHIDV